jgi:hypothetical protein
LIHGDIGQRWERQFASARHAAAGSPKVGKIAQLGAPFEDDLATREAASGLSRSMRWQMRSRSCAAGTDQRIGVMDGESAEAARPPAHA